MRAVSHLGDKFPTDRAGRVPVTIATILLVWAVFAVEHALVPAAGIPVGSESWLHMFATSTSRPLAVSSWVVAVVSHANLPHIVVNTVTLVVILGIVEDKYGSGFAAVLIFVAGVGTIGVGTLVYAVWGRSHYLLGASAVWSGLLPAAFFYRPSNTAIRVRGVSVPASTRHVVALIAVYFGARIHIAGPEVTTAHAGHLAGIIVGLVTVPVVVRVVVAVSWLKQLREKEPLL